jgi:hypothetical protein
MGKLGDIDITGLIKKKSGAPLGDAHELLVRSIMMRLGFEVGKVDLSSGAYDAIVAGMDGPGGKKIFLRIQVKTITDSLPLIGGVRAGVDRTYKSGVKAYKYSTEHSDLIFGIDKKSLDIYVVPTIFCSLWKTSVSKNRIKILKNNWDILLNWNKKYLDTMYRQLKNASR